MKRDHYEVLGITREASQKEIKSAYRKLAKQYHPDRNKEADASDKFKEVTEAYEVLSDEEKKSNYDRFGHEPPPSDSSDEFSAWTSFFRGFTSSSPRSGGFSGVYHGFDVEVRLEITFEEAAFGTVKSVQYPKVSACIDCNARGFRTLAEKCTHCLGQGKRQSQSGVAILIYSCEACAGTGRKVEFCTSCNHTGRKQEVQTAKVAVPPGVNDRGILRIAGQGGQSSINGPRGDVIIRLNVKDHPEFVRKDLDVVCNYTLRYQKALLGCTITVNTLHGQREVTVNAGTKDGDFVVLRKLGIKDYQGRVGDHYVHVTLVMPTNLSPEERSLLERIDQITST